MSICIRNVMLDGVAKDIFIDNNRIAEIGTRISRPADDEINGAGKAAIPGLMNGHTHAAMTLLRGYADDMELMDWLTNRIWPVEAKMTAEDVYWGTKLACLEMIKSGTVFFADMYWHWHAIARAVTEMGLRACIAGVIIDTMGIDQAQKLVANLESLVRDRENYPDRICLAVGPHAIYTVTTERLRWAMEFSDAHGLPLHIHLSETRKEVNDCVRQHGVRPVAYLERIGVLGANVVIAHAIWLDADEISILREHNVKVITNPCANMKLASGTFRYSDFHHAGLTIGIGTDGVASNNNFDLFEEMKFAALVEKSRTGDPTAAPAGEIFACGTRNVAKAYGIDNGVIAVGALADVVLVNLDSPLLTPGHNLISDLVYAANGSAVDTVICDGVVLMKQRHVDGEEEIIAKARETARRLVKR